MMMCGMLLATAALTMPPRDTMTVTVDSARHEIRITTGPYHIPATPEGHHPIMMDPAHNGALGNFAWPVDGWFRGFRLQLVDGHGAAVPRQIVHHLVVANLGRQQVLYPVPEFLLGVGAETEDGEVPTTIGVPMRAGMPLVGFIGWHNQTGHDFHEVYLTLTLLWTPKDQTPPPASALPMVVDANGGEGADAITFDIPPGRSSRKAEFTPRKGGRLLGVGGHLHDYGVDLRLEDAATDSVLVRIEAKRDSTGQVSGIARHLFDSAGKMVTLQAGRRYRVVGTYDNATKETIPGGMALLVGLFVPDSTSSPAAP